MKDSKQTSVIISDGKLLLVLTSLTVRECGRKAQDRSTAAEGEILSVATGFNRCLLTLKRWSWCWSRNKKVYIFIELLCLRSKVVWEGVV